MGSAASAAAPPSKKRPARNNRRNVPPEILEEILLYLPMKSLLRFSSASKSWNSMILGSPFVESYGGRQMIVLKPGSDGHLRDALVRPLSSVFTNKRNPLAGATPLVAPFKRRPYLVASCDELWCIQVQNTLILWNPSFPIFRKLPEPWLPPWSKHPPWSDRFRYGLGFDSVNSDYKMMKIFTYDNLRTGRLVETELYSLKSDSWKKIQPFPNVKIMSKFGLFVAGALHWLVRESRGSYVIISFDLSMEKYENVALPNVDRANSDLEMRVLRGMLCACVNYRDIAKFVIWVIEDYNQIPKTWTKEVEINYGDVPPGNEMRPFDYYDDDRNLVKAVISSTDDRNLVKAVISSTKKPEIFTYKKLGKESQVEVMNMAGDAFNGNVNVFNSLVYVEKPRVLAYIVDFRRCWR